MVEDRLFKAAGKKGDCPLEEGGLSPFSPAALTEDLLPPDLAYRMDQVCNAFEASWKAGLRPALESYLADAGPERSILLRELLALDLEYRKVHGERATGEEYCRRFPGHGDVIRSAFREAATLVLTPAGKPRAARDVVTAHFGAEPTTPQPSSKPFPVSVPGYEILEELGRGGMGVVYKARQLQLKRLVALKMISTGTLVGPAQRARFRAEAEAVARLHHANIVQIYEIGEQDGRPYFSLEYVEGGSLSDRLRAALLSAEDAARLTEALARAMHYAHQSGIVHRDLKPANILVVRGGVVRGERSDPTSPLTAHHAPLTPKITDFGLAKQLDSDCGQTTTGEIMGTPGYMAPEQAAGKVHEIGPAADIYALGAVLYEMLTGWPPFRGATYLDTLEQVRSQEPVPPSRVQPKVPRDLETICLKCLQKDPRWRYASAEALADDLRRFLIGEPILARPVSLGVRAAKWVKRRPAVALCAVAATIALLAAGTAVFQAMRAEVMEARQERQQLLAQVKRTQSEAEARSLLDQGRSALAQQDWENARLLLTRAQARIGEETAAPFDALGERIRQRLNEAEGRLQARERLQRFLRQRDEALFHATLFTGKDLATNLRMTREAAEAALGLAGLGKRDTALESPYQSEADKVRLREGCYELLLILAQTLAHPAPRQTDTEQHARLQEALGLLQQAADLGLTTRAYHLRRADWLSRLGDAAGADRERRRAEETAPVSALDHFLVGWESHRRAQTAQAIRDFEQALRQRPDHFWAQYCLAICYYREHQPAAAKASLNACLSQHDGFGWLYLLRGCVEGELGQAAREKQLRAEADAHYHAAEADFQKALQRNDDPATRYGVLVNFGVLRTQQERLDEAAEHLRAAIAVKPDEYQAYTALAAVFQKQKKLDEALTQLGKAIDLEPALASLYRTRAKVHLERGETDAALDDLDRVLERESRESSARSRANDYLEQARILYRAQRYPDALRATERALELRADLPGAGRLRADTLLHLAEAEEEASRKRACYEEALAALNQCLSQGGALADVYRARGSVQVRLGRQAAALDDYTRALELEPDAQTYALRGWLELNQSPQPKQALHDFEEALRLDPARGEAYNGRGLARAHLGQYREAVHDAEQALHRGPETVPLLYNAARIFAQASARTDTELGQASRRELELCFEYQDRALKLIRQSLETLPVKQRLAFWQESVRSDATLAALRRSPAFAELAARYTGAEK